jgi:hypothetical protein
MKIFRFGTVLRDSPEISSVYLNPKRQRGIELMCRIRGLKTRGYHRTSLREERQLCIAAERHFMVARPFKAGTTTPTIDCVAERQLMRDRRQSNTRSFMRRSATPWLLVASFPGVKNPRLPSDLAPRGAVVAIWRRAPEDKTGVASG